MNNLEAVPLHVYTPEQVRREEFRAPKAVAELVSVFFLLDS